MVQNNDSEEVAVPRHPLGIKPLGNAYTATQNIKFATGRFSHMPDEIIIEILEWLDGHALVELGRTCRAMYAFCHHDELWRTLFISSPPASFQWLGTWRSTYLGMSASKTSKITCKNLFSDVLHRPYFCAFTPLGPYTTSIPVQNEIPRLSELTMADFSKNWAGRPFILTDEITQWPAYKEWSTEALLKAYGDVEFRAEAVDWPLKTYVEYMNSNTDESPLYLFDRAFVEKMQVMVGQVEQRQYWTPRCFGEDLFAVLGEERPDSRWLIIGPERSGSTFHKDPNATSAWNAVLRGSKYWIMFPNSMKTPPGVYVSSDESEVTSPLSIAEWLISYHAEARKTLGCIEGICNEGEILYVPSGWWHLVVNLKPSIAITENFVPEAHLVNAMKFLRDKRNQVSGFKEDVQNPYDLFIQRMEQQDTRTLSEATKLLGNIGAGKKRKWDSLVNGTCGAKAEGRNDFSFGFGEASDEDLP